MKFLPQNGIVAFRIVSNRRFAAAVQHATSERGLQSPEQGAKVTKLPSGLLLASVDNNDPIAHVSLLFRAGSRYETTETRGIVHRLRNIIGLSTNHRTAIDFNHHVAQNGCVVTSAATRDHWSLNIQVFRRNVGAAFRLLDELFDGSVLVKQHELESSAAQMKRELSLLKDNWPAYILERLHKAAYRRDGLGNSLLSPKYAVGHHQATAVTEFAKEHFTTGNATLATVGVDQDEVLKWANLFFPLDKGSAVRAPEKPKSFGGELRKARPSELTAVYIGAPSVGLNDVKGTITHTVLANALGTGPLTKWNDGQNRLAKAVRKATSNPFHVSASNIGYEGAGLFTLFYSSHWADSGAVAKAVLGELRNVASSGISDKELQAAKNRTKYRILSLAENSDHVLEDLAVQAAVRQTDLYLANDQTKLVDAVTANDLQQAAKVIVSSKLALSAIGRLDKTPYLDELTS